MSLRGFKLCEKSFQFPAIKKPFSLMVTGCEFAMQLSFKAQGPLNAKQEFAVERR